MALLHSFYCWGQVAVVVGTTVVLGLLGQGLWPALPLLWAVVPLVNLVLFLRVPMPDTVAEEHRTPVRKLLGTSVFLLSLIHISEPTRLGMISYAVFCLKKKKKKKKKK